MQVVQLCGERLLDDVAGGQLGGCGVSARAEGVPHLRERIGACARGGQRAAQRRWAAYRGGLRRSSAVEERVVVVDEFEAVVEAPERLAVPEQQPAAGHQ